MPARLLPTAQAAIWYARNVEHQQSECRDEKYECKQSSKTTNALLLLPLEVGHSVEKITKNLSFQITTIKTCGMAERIKASTHEPKG